LGFLTVIFIIGILVEIFGTNGGNETTKNFVTGLKAFRIWTRKSPQPTDIQINSDLLENEGKFYKKPLPEEKKQA